MCIRDRGLAAPSKEQSTAQQINENLVYEIKVDDEINGSMENYVARAYAEAEADQAAYMLLVLDTYGGYLDNAVNIKQIIVNSSVQTICFVNDKAISAGALIALACDEIIMAPGSTMGAAEPKVNGEKADEKTVSFWSAELSSTAELHDRNGLIAAAMADSDIEIENVVEKGKLLTLTADQAVDLGRCV